MLIISRYDLTNTFDIIVGKAPSSQRFTVHTDVLTSHSNFLKAAHKPEWLADRTKPVYLSDEEPDVFSRYFNCVYSGSDAIKPDGEAPPDPQENSEDTWADSPVTAPDAFVCPVSEHEARIQKAREEPSAYVSYIDQHFRVLAQLYLLAEKLQDIKTANLVMDEIQRFSSKERANADDEIISLVYEATVRGNLLRKWLRDTQVYHTLSTDYMLLHAGECPREFYRDVAVEFLRLKQYEGKPARFVWRRPEGGKLELIDKCRYHLHDEENPSCVPEQTK